MYDDMSADHGQRTPVQLSSWLSSPGDAGHLSTS